VLLLVALVLPAPRFAPCGRDRRDLLSHPSVNGFLCFRRFVFRTADRPLLRYLRYNLIYVPLLLIYMLVLPLALAHAFLSAYVMQALFTLVAIVLGYMGNKYFAFRVSPRE
jgi:hypothetical protein